MPTKNVAENDSDDLRREYDLAKLKGGVRGKYYERATAGTTLVLLDRDVAEAFPDGTTVNQALRALIKVAETKTRGAGHRLANTYQPSPRQVRRSSPSGRRVKKTRDRKR